MEGLIDMNIRHGDYELRPYNDSCWCIYRVMPEVYDNSSSKLRLAEDGRALKSMEKYPVSIADGLRIVRRLVLADGGGAGPRSATSPRGSGRGWARRPARSRR
ncbi:MAG: hypothetical protein SOY67_02725 [Collinsella sp.]|nr:hypothetical protein [Collinsella sp.]